MKHSIFISSQAFGKSFNLRLMRSAYGLDDALLALKESRINGTGVLLIS
ncbi:MAG: hypothetical protein AB1798_00585 [Spirochaetota bacterium]